MAKPTMIVSDIFVDDLSLPDGHALPVKHQGIHSQTDQQPQGREPAFLKQHEPYPRHVSVLAQDEILEQLLRKIYALLRKLWQHRLATGDDQQTHDSFFYAKDVSLYDELEQFTSRLAMITTYVGSLIVNEDATAPIRPEYLWSVAGHSSLEQRKRRDVREYTQALLCLIGDIDKLGLKGLPFRRALAQAGQDLLKASAESICIHLSKSAPGDSFGDDPDRHAAHDLIRNSTGKIFAFVDQLDGDAGGLSPRHDPETWLTFADAKVMELSSKLLYDLTVQSPQVRDIFRSYVKTPSYRSKFSARLTAELTKRVRPDTTTVDVLEEFLCLLGVVRTVDPTGIVLQSPMEYVKEILQKRGDAVQIIVASMLEPFETTKPSGGLYCAPIAEAMHNLSAKPFQTYFESSDLTDLDWQPDPIDAQQGYRQSVYMDQITHLMDLQSQEQFIHVLQDVMAKTLVANEDCNLEMELRLLATIKARMKEELVKSLEVMIQDSLKSSDLDSQISQNITSSSAVIPEVHAKMLSHRFWPEFSDPEFKPPNAIKSAIEYYADKYRKIKDGRRLEWFSGVGSVEVELSIGDDCVSEKVTPLQAAIIARFSEDVYGSTSRLEDGKEQVGVCTLQDLKQSLFERTSGSGTASHDRRIKDALDFWVGKGVLKQVGTDKWVARESFNDEDGEMSSMVVSQDAGAEQGAAASSPPQPPQLQTPLDAILANEDVYANFVMHMLTNQGAMAAARILQFMKMLLPGGFPFQEADLVEFLQILQERGSLERSGANWRIPPGR